ncbi:MAG: hypothetical protein FWG37_03365 [Clostridia bacterium]|nr:hypothetical protein [Clostridia bacterium]
MGLFSKRKKKIDASDIGFALGCADGAIGFGSSGTPADALQRLGFQVRDFRSETEKQAERDAGNPLDEPLEQYANDIVNAFANYNGNSVASDSATKAKLRPIGEKLNNNEKQLRVFHRALHIAKTRNIRISTASMERFWEGCGGWQV